MLFNLLLFLMICMNMMSDNVVLEFIGIITKHKLDEWLCNDMTLTWLWVRILVNPKLNFFLPKFFFGMKVKGQRNPNSQGGAGKLS